MLLATTYDDLLADIRAMAQSVRPFDLPPLAVTNLSGFLALCETVPSPELQALADLCVAWPDRHRAPLGAAEIARRRGDRGLPSDADALLLRWGYPGVFARWQFHITLTRRLGPDSLPYWRDAAERHLEAALPHPRRVTNLCLFTQAGPEAPFLLAERIPLG